VHTASCTIRMCSSRSTAGFRTARNLHLTTPGANWRRSLLRSCFGPTRHISQILELQNCGQYTFFLETSQNTFGRNHPQVPAITLHTFPQCVSTETLVLHFSDIFYSSQTHSRVGSQVGIHIGKPNEINSWHIADMSLCKRFGGIC
jgi:hypothetical protein